MRCLGLGVFALILTWTTAARSDEAAGHLDFTHLTQSQQVEFWRKLDVLAMEQATVMHCGGVEDFAPRAKAAIHSCVTAESLRQAESNYRYHLDLSLKRLTSTHFQCTGKTNFQGQQLDLSELVTMARWDLDNTIKQIADLCRSCQQSPAPLYCY
jgi:hypothetical protein